jgi:hypothetical protein
MYKINPPDSTDLSAIVKSIIDYITIADRDPRCPPSLKANLALYWNYLYRMIDPSKKEVKMSDGAACIKMHHDLASFSWNTAVLYDFFYHTFYYLQLISTSTGEYLFEYPIVTLIEGKHNILLRQFILPKYAQWQEWEATDMNQIIEFYQPGVSRIEPLFSENAKTHLERIMRAFMQSTTICDFDNLTVGFANPHSAGPVDIIDAETVSIGKWLLKYSNRAMGLKTSVSEDELSLIYRVLACYVSHRRVNVLAEAVAKFVGHFSAQPFSIVRPDSFARVSELMSAPISFELEPRARASSWPRSRSPVMAAGATMDDQDPILLELTTNLVNLARLIDFKGCNEMLGLKPITPTFEQINELSQYQQTIGNRIYKMFAPRTMYINGVQLTISTNDAKFKKIYADVSTKQHPDPLASCRSGVDKYLEKIRAANLLGKHASPQSVLSVLHRISRAALQQKWLQLMYSDGKKLSYSEAEPSLTAFACEFLEAAILYAYITETAEKLRT